SAGEFQGHAKSTLLVAIRNALSTDAALFCARGNSADAAQPGGADSADDRGRALDKPSSRGLVHRLGSEVDDLQKISRLLCRTRPLPNVRFQGLDRSPLVAAAEDSTSRRSVRRQCALLRLSRSGLYHEPAPQGVGVDAAHRRPAHRLSVLREPAGHRLADPARGGGRPQAGAAAACGGVVVPGLPYLLRRVRMERPDQVWRPDMAGTT